MNTLFILVFAVALLGFIRLGLSTLPRERWQMFASIPVRKTIDGKWHGINLTYYGLLSANAYLLAALLFFLLMGSIGIPLPASLTIIAVILSICAPASRLIARIVEKKSHTFTVGGASFVGILLAPWCVGLISAIADWHLPVAASIAALSIAYIIGEGIGRLACVSFGCCYGKAISTCPPILQKIFTKKAMVFFGKTKKVCYEGHLDETPLVPVQSLTCYIYSLSGIFGIYLFFAGHYTAVYLLLITISQIWRFLSETLRADFRGVGNISAYQKMGLFAVAYAYMLPYLFPNELTTSSANVLAGLIALWKPMPILFFQVLWIILFLYTGCSMVTKSEVSFEVISERT